MVTEPITLTSKQFNYCLKLRLEYAEKLDAKYKELADTKRHLRLQNKLSQWNRVALDRLSSSTLTIVERNPADFHVIR